MNGCYRHNIDAKSRLFMPAKLREELGGTFYITVGYDNCLSAYSKDAWGELEKKINAMPSAKARHMQRMLFAPAIQCEPDSQGRVVLPQSLRDYAFLEKEAVVVGVSNRAEIWNAQRWDELERTVMSSEKLAEAMDELGL